MAMRHAATLLILVLLPGCAAQIQGGESSAGGSVSSVTASRFQMASSGANASVALSSGQAIPAGVPGGQVSVNGGPAVAALIVVGAVIAGLLDSLGTPGAPQPQAMAPGTRISHTCSCYGYQPPAEPNVARDQ